MKKSLESINSTLPICYEKWKIEAGLWADSENDQIRQRKLVIFTDCQALRKPKIKYHGCWPKLYPSL